MSVPSPRLRLLSEISLTAASKLSPPAVFSDVPAGSEVSTVNLSLSLSTTYVPHCPLRLKDELVGCTTASTVSSDMSPWITVSCRAVGVGREREREGGGERERERERKIQSMNLVMSFIKLLAGSVATVASSVMNPQTLYLLSKE